MKTRSAIRESILNILPHLSLRYACPCDVATTGWNNLTSGVTMAGSTL